MGNAIETVGGHFIVGLGGITLAAEEVKLLAELRPAGIIIFAHNVDKDNPHWVAKLQELIQGAKQAARRTDFLVAIDHEGGSVHRMIAPVTHFPPAQRWSKEAYAVGKVMGKELRALGFNLDFAPVLDIDLEKQNTVIGTRAFGKTKDSVTKAGGDFVRALHEEGVLACGKHFPGHGATIADSHVELPVLTSSKELLFQRELAPFQALINDGLRLIMTAHVLYPALDSKYPATLSPLIINSLLRQKLGFRHVVISDALEMKALLGIETKEMAAQSIEAGVDLLLVAQPKAKLPLIEARNHAASLRDALDAKRLSLHALESSAKRIDNLFSFVRDLEKGRSGLSTENVIGCQAHVLLAKRIKESADVVG